MKTRRVVFGIVLVILSLNFSGCIGVNYQFRKIRNHIFDNMNLERQRVIEFSVGPAGLLLAGMVVQFSDVDEPIDEILGQISRVQVGIYDKTETDMGKPDFSVLRSLSDLMNKAGWQYIVRTIDGDDMAAVFVRSNYKEEIEQLFVIALSDEELVLVELQGDLEEIVEIAIREKGFKFDVTDGF
ncbi:DUF4252 domain-containing protein [Bacteroidota bacterium]